MNQLGILSPVERCRSFLGLRAVLPWETRTHYLFGLLEKECWSPNFQERVCSDYMSMMILWNLCSMKEKSFLKTPILNFSLAIMEPSWIKRTRRVMVLSDSTRRFRSDCLASTQHPIYGHVSDESPECYWTSDPASHETVSSLLGGIGGHI